MNSNLTGIMPSLSVLHRKHRPNFTKEFEEEKQRLPIPSHRHAAPSAPWPWVDIHDEIDPQQLESEKPPVPDECDHSTCGKRGGCWPEYPQSLFPNWTFAQVEKSKISDAIANYNKDAPCKIYHVDVNNHGVFTSPGVAEMEVGQEIVSWDRISHTERPENLRVRALFLENLSGPVLQMLGTKYDIEPFFWSSSLNWIPSRYQENPIAGEGDHITVTLTFLKSMEEKYNQKGSQSTESLTSIESVDLTLTEQMIDTQAPLRLRSKRRVLVLDLLSVHLIRRKDHGSTIISYHPNMPHHPVTEARYLRDRIRYAGQSVYWQMIFQKSPDPTFVLLTFVWHALYAWDEALEHLYNHICWLETRVISTNDMALTQELHVIRAHHLHYTSLLEDYQKTVEFIKKTYNPAMDSVSPKEREYSAKLLVRECDNLLSEIERLGLGCKMQDRRLKNVMNLVFSSVNIQDSKRMQQMTEAAVKDSAGMKQIAYLTMIFLPSSFVAAVFGMNIKNLVPQAFGTLAHYFEVAIPLTMITIWVVVTFQSKNIYPEGTSLFTRLGWPVQLCLNLLKYKDGRQSNESIPVTTKDLSHS